MNKIHKLLNCFSSVFLLLFFCGYAFASPQDSLPINWKLNIKWKDIPLSEINLPYEKVDLKDGKLDLSFIINRQSNSEISYEGQGNITDGIIYLAQWDDEILNIEGAFTFKEKKVEISSCKGIFRDVPLTADGQISLEPPYSFEAEITAKDVTIDDVSPLFPFIEPHIEPYRAVKTEGEMNFVVEGVLQDGPFEGKILLPLASFHSILMNNVEVSFIYQDREILLKNFSVNVDEGNISGEGEILIKQKSSE